MSVDPTQPVVSGCPACGALKSHSVKCPLLTDAQKAEFLDEYYQAWLGETRSHELTRKRLTEMVTLWQGKHALLRHENNKLRRKKLNGAAQKQRIAELEDCLRVIERKIRGDTAPILTLVRAFGGEETKRAWKEAICDSAVRAHVILGEK